MSVIYVELFIIILEIWISFFIKFFFCEKYVLLWTVTINVIYRDNKTGSTLVSNEHVKNARAVMSLAVFSVLDCNLPLFIREEATTCDWKVVKIGKT